MKPLPNLVSASFLPASSQHIGIRRREKSPMVSQKAIVILHGWQSEVSRWQPLVKILQKDFKVYLPRLPGFGEKKLTRAWNLEDYVAWLKDYLSTNRIVDPIFLAHSFGGRVAIKFIVQGNKVQKLIIIASAGIKPKNNFKKFIFQVLAKFGKIFFFLPPFSFFKKPASWLLYTLIREKDYYQADKFLKLTMRKISKQDLKPLLKNVQVPTLILWGRQDKITPTTDAEIFHRKIKDSRLIIFDNAGHNLPFALTKEVAFEIAQFCR